MKLKNLSSYDDWLTVIGQAEPHLNEESNEDKMLEIIHTSGEEQDGDFTNVKAM